ncbi:MAG: hypothetical protein Q8L28_01235 [bacterium]|nr:hypothetical protein [bacterium]
MAEQDEKANQFDYGIMLSALTPEILGDVAKIYDETVGGHGFQFISGDLRKELSGVKQDLERGNSSEWRCGSKLSPHSKLKVYRNAGFRNDQLIKFIFFPNLDEAEEKMLSVESETLKLSFKTKINEYLQNIGLAVPLTS